MQFFRKLLIGFLAFAVLAGPSLAWFDDITDELTPETIEFLRNNGVGEASQNFYPNRPVSLAEFLVMGLTLADVAGLQANATTRFEDVPADSWFAGAVAKADDLGLLADFRGDRLLPNRPLNRGEIVSLGLKIFGIGVPTAVSTEDFGFRDVGKNHRLARFIFRAVKMGVIDPITDTEFGVTRRVDRAEAATLFYNLASFEEGPTIVIQNGVTRIPNFPLFETVWNEAQNKFLFQDRVDNTQMIYSAIQGMIKSLDDPYSEFYTPEQTQQQVGDLSGEVEGIGVYIEADPEERGVLVVAPIYNSPAERAGLRAGDIITAVDGESLEGLPLLEAANLTRGLAGTTARYTIWRDDHEFTVEIIREKIKLDLVSVEFKNGIAIVDINQFTSALPEDFAKVVEKIKAQRPHGIILDLRNNGGGLVNSAVDLLGYFLPKGAIVASQEAREGYESLNLDYRTEREPIFNGLRTLVLVNRGTASASEIVAAALQDHGLASVIGEQTFGKGTVQEINFFGDGTALKLTIAHWLSPRKQPIDGQGVAPDFASVDDPETPIDEAVDYALEMF
ncbi:MAG: S-layer homology domain-containing protein [Candidatus Peribacteraceae bacterium]|nr:S-layer homology domain-containing protein [Candidatus Peribacteraceae bacterium]